MNAWMRIKHFLHLDFKERAARAVELRNRERSHAASARFSRGNVARQHGREDSVVEAEELREKLRWVRLAR